MKYLRWLGEALIFVMALLCLTVALGLMSGCASQAELQTLANSRDNVVRAQTEMQSQPLFTIKCGQDGCRGLDFAYTPAPAVIIVPSVKGTNDVIVGVAPAIASSVTWLGGAFAATRIVDDIMSSTGTGNTNTHNTTAISTEGDVQFSSTSTLSNTDTTSLIGDTRTMDNHSITDSYNPVDDNSAVSVPTIVTNQVPVIVKPQVVRP